MSENLWFSDVFRGYRNDIVLVSFLLTLIIFHLFVKFLLLTLNREMFASIQFKSMLVQYHQALSHVLKVNVFMKTNKLLIQAKMG